MDSRCVAGRVYCVDTLPRAVATAIDGNAPDASKLLAHAPSG